MVDEVPEGWAFYGKLRVADGTRWIWGSLKLVWLPKGVGMRVLMLFEMGSSIANIEWCFFVEFGSLQSLLETGAILRIAFHRSGTKCCIGIAEAYNNLQHRTA